MTTTPALPDAVAALAGHLRPDPADEGPVSVPADVIRAVITAAQQESGHALLERLIPLQPPKDRGTAKRMDAVRYAAMTFGRVVVDATPAGTEDQKLAIRAVHDASQRAIAAIACNQEEA